jgi:hypothetical protein
MRESSVFQMAVVDSKAYGAEKAKIRPVGKLGLDRVAASAHGKLA